jgi:predicted transcriptional regulator
MYVVYNVAHMCNSGLYGEDSSFKRKKKILASNRRKYTQYSRKIVLKQYRTYHSVVDELDFEYLAKRNDSLVVPLIKQMIKNRKVDTAEINRLNQILNLQSKNKW